MKYSLIMILLLSSLSIRVICFNYKPICILKYPKNVVYFSSKDNSFNSKKTNNNINKQPFIKPDNSFKTSINIKNDIKVSLNYHYDDILRVYHISTFLTDFPIFIAK